MADPNAKIRDIVRRNLCESAHTVTNWLIGQGRKLKRTSAKAGGKKTARVNYRRKNIKRHLFLHCFIRDVGMAAEALSISSEFDTFAQKPVKTSVQETIETILRPIASVNQSDLEFLITAENDTHRFEYQNVRGKLTAADGKDLEATDFTATTNLLHSLFTQCSITERNDNYTDV